MDATNDTSKKRKHDSQGQPSEISQPSKKSRKGERRAAEAAQRNPPEAMQSNQTVKPQPSDSQALSTVVQNTPSAPTAEQTERRAARKERKKQKRLAKQLAKQEPGGIESTVAVRNEEGPGVGRLFSSTERVSRNTSWKPSRTTAGRFLGQDPVFVQDDDQNEFLVAATQREVQILSLDTSLVERSFSVPTGHSVTCFTAIEDVVYVACNDQNIYRWQWTADGRSEQVQKAPGIVKAIVSKLGSHSDLLYYIATTKQGCRICCGGDALYNSPYDLQTIQIIGDGEYILANGTSVWILGVKRPNSDSEASYTWLQMPHLAPSACMSARLITQASSSKKTASKGKGFRLAIGYVDGKIQLYDDVSTIFNADSVDLTLPPPRLLHWHRDAVSSVKFSKDGNYLISGGRETVLVLWQLETGHKQFLPHLTSELEHIVVSPEGDRYAVQMGDNSIMVLSTSELKPVANFAGLQMLHRSANILQAKSSTPAATLHPQIPNLLLLSVPATQPKSHQDISARPFLQTFDMQTSRHVARQALTRNNVTDLNRGPEKTPIVPPDVQFLATSAAGSWMATVDEWTPPESDLDSFASGKADIEIQRSLRREVYLKFWRWDQAQSLWTLTTRVDSPHARPSADGLGAGVVQALVANPTKNGFATLGEDGCVRLWKVRRRMRSGVPVKNDVGEEVMEWTCARTVRLEDDEDRADSPMLLAGLPKLQTASLAYAPDGSMLAAVHSSEESSSLPVVYFIDTAGGEMIPKAGLAATAITSVGFVDRYFIAVTRPAVYVWDLVTDVLKHKIENSEQIQYGSWKAPMLTPNAADGSFAIVTHGSGKGATMRVYDPAEAKCVHSELFGMDIETVLAGSDSKGYTILFADATIQTLGPSAGRPRKLDSHGVRRQPFRRAALSASIAAGSAVEDTAMTDLSGGIVSRPRHVRSEEDDRPVVRPEQLAEIFEVGGVVMPPVKDMFRAIAGLFGRKPYVPPPVEVET